MRHRIESQLSERLFFGAASNTTDVNNDPHSVRYKGTREEMSVAGACTHPDLA